MKMAIHVVGSTSGVPVSANLLFLLLDSEDDAPDLLTDFASAAIGSRAFTANLGYQSIKGGDGIWHERAVVEAAEAANEAAELANTKAGLANDAAALAAQKAGIANDAATLANQKAGLASAAAESAEAAAAGASAYADQYHDLDAGTRLILSQYQAYIRALEKRLTTLEAQVAAIANG